MSSPKKLAMLPPTRCTEEFKWVMERAAEREQRKLADLQRVIMTEWLVIHHPDMVSVDADGVTDFGALPCDARKD